MGEQRKDDFYRLLDEVAVSLEPPMESHDKLNLSFISISCPFLSSNVLIRSLGTLGTN